jgi:sodium/potassium-transporting ATPase subunit alpha
MIPALGLGAEPPDGAVMRRPPRQRTDRLLSAGLLARAYLFLGSCQAVASMAAFFFVLSGAGWRWGQSQSADSVTYRQATTACLTAIVLMQVVNVQLCRSRRTSIFAQPLFGNPLITLGIAAEMAIILVIDYTPAGQALFGTASIGWSAWAIVLPFALGTLMLDEARKAIMRRVAEPSRTDTSAGKGLAPPAAPPPTR